jgi:FtsP/CotA-like multicopper oxidase with cupredoxin domain
MKNRTLLFLGIIFLLASGAVWLFNNAPRSTVIEQPLSASNTLATRNEEGTASATSSQGNIVSLKDGDAYTLTAESAKEQVGGKTIDALTYNGVFPGPLIRVPQGATIRLTLVNKLNEETTLHPHGIRTENASDGVPDVTQKPIEPGGSFTYILHFPDAGVYWYHPHMHEVEQQDLGMYGNFIVVPTSTDYWSPVNREEALIVDDILLNRGDVVPYGKDSSNFGLMGRYGNVMLVNGQTDYKLDAKKGEVIRFYMTNAANARPFNLSFQGAKMKLVGADNGKYEKEQWADHVILGPSERAIVEVLFDQPGSYKLVNETPTMTSNLATVNVSDSAVETSYATQFNSLRTNQDVIASIDPFRSVFAKQPDKTIVLNSKMMGGMMGGMGMNMGMDAATQNGIEWDDSMQMMNARMSAASARWTITDEATGLTNDKIQWSFKKGDMVKIQIKNPETGMHPMQHPIHFHGQRFLVLDVDGQQTDDYVWKDTVLVPAGKTIDILVDMSNPGTWMAHCHISEHLESGMMLKYSVE